MRAGIIVILCAACVAGAAAGQATPASSGAEVCAQAGDAENLCDWGGAVAGTHGRRCTLDVEKISDKAACDYTKAWAPAITDHKPECFSVADAEHIGFISGKGRRFRVRRFIRITKTASTGASCPKNPFTTPFSPTHLTFGTAFDSKTPQASAAGCQYKLEVQFSNEADGAPAEPYDPKHHHYECRDPHIKVVSNLK